MTELGGSLLGWGEGDPHLLDPGPQVGGALVEASVLDEVALAGGLHLAAVVPVKVVQEGGVLVQLLAGAERAAGVLPPGTALGGADRALSPSPTTHLCRTLFLPIRFLLSCPR